MRKGTLALALACVWASCSLFTGSNPAYCTQDAQCPEPSVCNLPKHACETPEARPDDPTITAISPSAAGRQGGFEVTISGRYFDKLTQILFAGVPGTNLTIRSSNQVSITIPAGPGLCGLTTLTLKTSDGRTVRDSTHFRYRAANVQFPAGQMFTGPVGAGPAALITTRPRSVDYDDIIIGYASPTKSFSYVLIESSGAVKNEQFVTTGAPNVIDINKMALTTVLPGTAPSLLVGNLADRIVMYQSVLNNNMVFLVPPGQPVVSGYVDYAFGDFDKDGKQDMVVLASNATSTSVNVYKSDVDGAYTVSSTGGPVAIGESGHLAVGDLDRDGYDDLVLASKAANHIDILMNNRAGGFIGPDVIITPGASNNIIVKDMDLDGLLDIVAFGRAGQSSPAVTVLYNESSNGFTSVEMAAISGMASQAVLDDLDCDGLPDMVVYDGTRVRFYANTGRGTQFGAGVDLGAFAIQALAIGAFGGDALNDIALLQSSCSEVMPGKGCLRLLLNGSN